MRFKWGLFKGVLIALILTLVPITAFSAQKITPGSTCKVLNQKVVYQNKTYTCIKSGKRLIWTKGVAVKKPTPSPAPTVTVTATPYLAPTVTVTATPTPSSSPSTIPQAIQICSGIANSEQNKFKVSIQLMNPFDKSRILNGGGIFLKVNSIWANYPADINGRIDIFVVPGRYDIDTLGPLRSEFLLSRKRFLLNVEQDGRYSISNSKLVDKHCQISSELSSDGLKRNFEVNNKDYKFVVDAIDVRPSTKTVNYTAPISNSQANPIELELYPWESEHFVLLTISNQHNPVVIGRLLRALDLSYKIYDEATSNFPKYTISTSPWSRMINGKSVIAEIPDISGIDSSKIISCGGNACTAVSTFGIEVRWQVLESTLWMLEHFDVYDHVLFYEQGRTFWPQNSCSRKISLKNDWGNNYQTATGFANLMSKLIMKKIGLNFGPEENVSGDLHYQQVLAIEGIFSKNPNQNLFNIFDNKITINGFEGNNIWSSLMTYLGENLGGFEFYKKFFSSCNSLPDSQSNLMTVRNWKTLAELAAGKNLDSIFIQRWRMP